MSAATVLVSLVILVVGVALGVVIGWLAGARRSSEQWRDDGQVQVLTTLAPVAEQVRAMQDKVEQMERQRHEQGAVLAQQIHDTRLSVEESRRAADSLASALKNNQVRGVWGEVQLQTLVETAGLLHRVDFDTQVVGTNAEGAAIKPDMVINLPGGRTIAVDAKAPGGDYFEAHAADISPEERAQRLTAHALKVRGHVTALARKGYWTGIGPAAQEFTVAFIPSDAMLAAAFEADPSLQEWSYQHGVILTSPSSLFALLKTVAYSWQAERTTDDAREVLRLGQELYARIERAADGLGKLGRSLHSTVSAYNGFVATMEGRVLPTARKLNSLDESRAFGEVAPLDSDSTHVREAVAPELQP